MVKKIKSENSLEVETPKTPHLGKIEIIINGDVAAETTDSSLGLGIFAQKAQEVMTSDADRSFVEMRIEKGDGSTQYCRLTREQGSYGKGKTPPTGLEAHLSAVVAQNNVVKALVEGEKALGENLVWLDDTLVAHLKGPGSEDVRKRLNDLEAAWKLLAVACKAVGRV